MHARFSAFLKREESLTVMSERASNLGLLPKFCLAVARLHACLPLRLKLNIDGTKGLLAL